MLWRSNSSLLNVILYNRQRFLFASHNNESQSISYFIVLLSVLPTTIHTFKLVWHVMGGAIIVMNVKRNPLFIDQFFSAFIHIISDSLFVRQIWSNFIIKFKYFILIHLYTLIHHFKLAANNIKWIVSLLRYMFW